MSEKVQGTLEGMRQHATRRSGAANFEVYLLLGADAHTSMMAQLFHCIVYQPSALRRLQYLKP